MMDSQPTVETCEVTFPSDGVMLVTINRPQAMNSLTSEAHWQLDALWTWFDQHPNLNVAILTGKGNKAFSAGMDLKAALSAIQTRSGTTPTTTPASGFGGVSRRTGRKPIIAAVNGHAHGGGCEMVLNCDLVIASNTATFALPEAKRGVAALAGGFSRAERILGLQRAMDMVLTGRRVLPEEMKSWGVVKAVVPPDQLLPTALSVAKEIADCSPDSVIVSRAGVREGWENGVSSERRVGQTSDTWPFS